jgi:mannitol/fructose-specific phosphotransferase system IIA component (Ntr-type)
MMINGSLPLASCAPIEVVELRHKRRDSVLAQLVSVAHKAGVVTEPDLLLASLLRGQKLGSSAVGRGYAVPHARSLAVSRSATVFGRSGRGIEWGGGEDEPVQLVLLVLSPAVITPGTHADRVVSAVHALRLQRMRQRLLEAECAAALALLAGTTA